MGSSEVSLTPAVMRDPVTDEMVLEGALVLADNGICCIDEIGRKYTKLWSKRPHHLESGNHHDTHRTSLTPILTVANPLYGRYNPKVSPLENINLPAALLSRFDLLFLLLDKPSRDDSERLAQHVTHVHLYNGHLDFEYEPLAPALMRYGAPLPHLPTLTHD
ncbi:DNA replication licensing factor [Lactarius deliciosus]|nr:DNA replication licensing factor [Lactarius deliciosus]